MKIWLFAAVLSLVSPAYAEPIELSGINISQSKTEQILKLLDEGFECKENVLFEGLPGYVLCSNGSKNILPGDESIKFSCENFNACSYSLQELSQALLDEGMVKEVTYSVENVRDGSNNYQTEKYCGRGQDGDIVCATSEDTLLGTRLLRLVIERGSLGSGGIKLK